MATGLRETLADLDGFRAISADNGGRTLHWDPLPHQAQIPVRLGLKRMRDAGFEPATSCL